MRLSLGAAAAACLMAIGCADGQSSHSSLWVTPASLEELRDEHFLDVPWPSDLRLENGAPRLDGFYNPRQRPVLDEYVAAMRGALDGFSPVAAGYLRFDGPLDPGTLPDNPLVTVTPYSSVQLLDVDPASPERGHRRPVTLHWREQAGVYWLPNTLAFMPTLGFPLRPKTRYALVVTDALAGADGGSMGASPELREVLGLATASDRTAPTRDAFAPAVDEIEAAGVPRDRIVHLTVFTTGDPTAELYALRDHAVEHVPAPEMRPSFWQFKDKGPAWNEYVGQYGPSPNYQFGKMPFANVGDGGGFRFEDGAPVVEGLYDMRFSLTVPKAEQCPMPEAGYPIAMYAHGTGGDYRSYVLDGSAAALAERCIATMGVDQIFHGTRWGSPSDDTETGILFFNFQNVVAARSNGRQSAIDEVQRARLFSEGRAAVPATVSLTGKEIRFDGSRLMFFGHSQGGHNGPLFLAADSAARGGVLSGSSSLMSITLLEKTKPAPSVAAAVETLFLGLVGDEGDELNELHPAISLAQTIVDVVDPIHYAASIARSPRPGFAPKSIYMTEGVNPDGTGDSYAPPHGIEVHALAMGLPLQAPGQRALEEARWGGPAAVTIPPEGLSGNLADGAASGVLAQWPVPSGTDGHFVIFNVKAAQDQAAEFLRHLADEPAGRVPAP